MWLTFILFYFLRSTQISGIVHHADFRSASPQHPNILGGIFLKPVSSTTAPTGPTGLSVLMNGDVATSLNMQHSTSTPTAGALSVTMSPDQRQRYQQDMLERDHQASALAAAGMVAESVTHSLPVQGLLPPPQLVSNPSLPAPTSTTTELDSINWNLMDIGAINLDDMDMDFASLFDPATELAHMHASKSGEDAGEDAMGFDNTEGSGQP
jgi:hypothetical protein